MDLNIGPFINYVMLKGGRGGGGVSAASVTIYSSVWDKGGGGGGEGKGVHNGQK